MFRIQSIFVFLFAIGLFVWHARVFSQKGMRDAWLSKNDHPRASIAGLRRIAVLLAVGSLLVLALSGFLPKMLAGTAPAGIALLIHVTIAPLFTVSLMLWVVLSAQKNALHEQDWRNLAALFGRNVQVRRENEAATRLAITKVCFWGLAILAVPVSLSIMVSMTDWLGTSGQASALSLHKYSALAFFLLAVLMAHFILTGQQREVQPNSSPKKQAPIDAAAKN